MKQNTSGFLLQECSNEELHTFVRNEDFEVFFFEAVLWLFWFLSAIVDYKCSR